MLHTIRQLLDTKSYQICSISPDATLYEALEIMASNNTDALVVCEEGKPVGMVSARDCAHKIIMDDKTSRQTRVGEVMSSLVQPVDPQQTIRDCMHFMANQHIRHAPVVEDGKVIGVISIHDLLDEIVLQQNETIRFLEDLTLDV